MATDETISKRADALRRLIKTQSRAWGYILGDPAHVDEAPRQSSPIGPTASLIPKSQGAPQSGEFFDTPTRKETDRWQSPEDGNLPPDDRSRPAQGDAAAGRFSPMI